MQGLIDHGTATPYSLNTENKEHSNEKYTIYFGLGLTLSLTHSPEVFKVSPAGVKLGNYLIRTLDSRTSKQSFLDVGTGSGVHALLMSKLGNNDVTATDISEQAIEHAKHQELNNLKKHTISFYISDLFTCIPERTFQTIVFNPPGWRTPSRSLMQRLKTIEQTGKMPIEAMFYGEEVVNRFLDGVPRYLSPTGTAIVGVNSLVGIRDILYKYNKKHKGKPPLAYRLVERHTLPLLYYSTHWQSIQRHLKIEFENWLKQDLAAYSTDKNGNIFWSYEIIEFFHRKH